MLVNRAIGAATAACLAFACAPVSAGTATNTVPAILRVESGCSLQARPLSFVASNALLSVNIDATTTLTVACAPNTSFSIEIDDGLNPQATNKRRMTGPLGTSLAYNVYLDSGRKNVWGKGNSKNFSGNSGSGSPINVPVYGRVPAAALTIVGQYDDTLTVTLNF
ncbi:spore coat U domain-containing protein [Altererythrobacter sp. TH136]|uniref:Csu type fimbrial protein n=1 Tax=Altererythrobacter sp. TH136 TaxID=2067415 RepID=UPI001FEDED96|nr:spore coat U domain-containing protein [Altererythrobacter sp. TH136]